MAIDFISIDANSKYGRLVTALAKNLRTVREDAAEIKQLMAHMRADNGSNGAAITTNFGVPPNGDASAAGEGAFTVITNVDTALAANGITTMIERVG